MHVLFGVDNVMTKIFVLFVLLVAALYSAEATKITKKHEDRKNSDALSDHAILSMPWHQLKIVPLPR